MKITMGGIDFDVQEMGRDGALGLLMARMNLETRADMEYTKKFVMEVARVCEATSPSAAAMDKLRRACGYIENGTSDAVTICQDDATKDWLIKAGKQQTYGSSIEDALSKVEIDDDMG